MGSDNDQKSGGSGEPNANSSQALNQSGTKETDMTKSAEPNPFGVVVHAFESLDITKVYKTKDE